MKTCNNCGSHNPDESKFCYNCGSKITEKSGPGIITCGKCGFSNDAGGHFCLNCGAELRTQQNVSAAHSNTSRKNHGQKHKTTTRKNRPSKSHNSAVKRKSGKFRTLWIIPAVIIGSLAIASMFDLGFHSYSAGKPFDPNIKEIKSLNPEIEKKVDEIASQFTCTCGKCNESLTECTCEKAVEERSFIRSYAELDKKNNVIENAVKNRFGGMN